MSELKIEGDLSLISERQLEYIKSVLEKRGYSDSQVQMKPVGSAGDNYVANVKRVTVEDGKGTFKMIAKIAPSNPMLRASMHTELLFRNEHIMYTKVLPKYSELEKSADIPPSERLRYAECYGSLEEAPNEVILLEDLNESNFKMLNRMEPLGMECIKSVLRNFSILHSLGFALKQKEPELYDEIKYGLFDMWSAIPHRNDAMAYFKQLEIGVGLLVESEFHKKVVSSVLTDSLNAYSKIAAAERDSKHSIIQQADAWTNNIMFRYDGENLLGSVMIDYQMSKSGSPASDVLYLLCNCTDYEMRKEHFHDWIDYYHSELDKSLSKYGLKADYVYPKHQLDADLKKYGKLGLGQTVLLTSIVFLKSDDAEVMKDAMETGADPAEHMAQAPVGANDPETLALIKRRIEGIIDSYNEFGLI